MRFRRITFTLFCLLLSISVCHTQSNISDVQYTTQSGMLSNVTYHGIFDQSDFLWICQNHGLSRFDGTHFTNFTVDDGLPDNDVVCVTEDTKGTIWAQPFQREAAFLKKGAFRFQNVNTIIHPDTVKKDQFYRVFALKNGKVGLVTESGVIRILGNDRWISSYYLNTPLLYFNIFLYEPEDGKIILLSSQNQFIIDLSKKTLQRKPFYRFVRIDYNNEWICFQNIDNSSSVLCENIRSKKQYLIEDVRTSHRFGIFKTGVLINQDGANLSFYNFRTKKVTDLAKQVILAHAIENKAGTVQVLFTADNGIHLQSREPASGTRFKNKSPAFFYLNENQIYVSDAVGNLLNLPNDAKKNISSETFVSGVFSEKIRGMDLVYGGKTIISNENELVREAAKMRGSKAVYLLNDSIRYVATYKGAFLFNNRTRRAKNIYLGRTTAISAGPKGSIFIGTIRGLIEYRSDGKLIDWSETGKFRQIRITDLCFRKQVLWVATAGNGLSAIFNGKAHSILNSKNGTSRNHIETIEESDNNQLYLGYTTGAQKLTYTFDGYQIHLKNLVTLDIFKDDGIRDFFFHNGIVYGLSTTSLYQFNTRKKIPVRSFQLQITRLSLNNVIRKVQRQIVVNAGKYDLQIEFSTQNYQRLPIHYRYQVNKEEWNYLSDGSLSLDKLGPGEYQVTIQVLNNYNRPSDSQIITISIAYPFYVQSWFIISTAFCLVVLIYLLARYYTKNHFQKLNDKLIQQNKLRELELIALKAQINPHFVFNCLNTIKGLIHQKRILEADLYIDRFAQLFRNTLEASFEQDYPLSSEINYLRAYLEIEQMSMNYRFDFEFLIDPAINPDQTFIPAMLLQPHVENAVKHGVSILRERKGMISISFQKQDDFLVCTVRDNGPGRIHEKKQAEHHTGKGISITEKRARLYAIETAFIEHGSEGVSIILKLQMTKQHDSRTHH